MDASPDTLILIDGERTHAAACALAEGVPHPTGGALSLMRVQGEPTISVSTMRERHGSATIGYIGLDEHAALEALEAGADEAAVWPLDVAAWTRFIDRVELRGRLRRERQRLAESFAHAEKLTALGTLVAGVGHEINNPLSAISLSVEAARHVVNPALEVAWELDRVAQRGEALPPEDVARLAHRVRGGRAELEATDLLAEMGDAVTGIAEVVRDLRVFARTDREERSQLVDLSDILDQAIRLVGREISSHGAIERDYGADLPRLVLPRNRLVQVLTNVLINAGHAIREVDRPMHRVRVTARADDEYVAITVTDTGPGIPVDALGKIFDPFFTTKRQEIGTGLGLSISRSILRRMGGDLLVDSVYGDGATFVCLIPRPTDSQVRDAYVRGAMVQSRPSSLPELAVLAVDDDERVLRGYARFLRDRFKVLLARDAYEAIELLASGSQADVLVTELSLPDMDGVALFRWIQESRPALARRVVVATARADVPEYAQFLAEEELPCIEKPIQAEPLIDAIGAAIARCPVRGPEDEADLH